MKKITLFISIFSFILGVSQNLITNGDFENGITGWSGNQGVIGNIVTSGGNSYFSFNVVAPANPWDANLSYVLPLGPEGTNYKLKFDAWSNAARTLIAGIGLNQDPWTNTVSTVNLTSTSQTFELTFVANINNPSSRIIFDMGNVAGLVNIDNVSLEVVVAPTPALPLIQNFEDPTTYTALTGFGGAAATIVTDPATGEANGNVLRGTQGPGGEVFQGIEFVLTTKKVKLTSNKTMQVDVFASQAFNILAKVELGGAAPNSANGQAYTTPGQWQTLTFNFAVPMDNQQVANGEYEKIIFFGNWNATNTGFNSPVVEMMYYIDNIRAEEGVLTPPPADPTVAAPNPPARPAADVKSIFSDAYTPISEIGYTGEDNTFNNSWCGAVTTLIQIEGNNTHKVTGLGCEGVTFLDGRFDATEMTNFHIDIFTNSETLDKSFNVKFSNWNGGNGEANAIEFSFNNSNFLPAVNPGTWLSLDIPLANFLPINGANRNDIVQFVITSDLGIVYYDNLYLHKNTLSSATNELSQFSMYPNPANDVLNIKANGVIESISVFNIVGQKVLTVTPNENFSRFDVNQLPTGVYVVKSIIEGVESSAKFIKK